LIPKSATRSNASSGLPSRQWAGRRSPPTARSDGPCSPPVSSLDASAGLGSPAGAGWRGPGPKGDPLGNLAVVRAVYEAFASNDIDAAFAYLDPAFELWASRRSEGCESFWGREGIERWIAMMEGIRGEWLFDPERLIAAGNKVVALVPLVDERGSSQVPGDRRVAHLWRLRGGRAITALIYFDRPPAFKRRRTARFHGSPRRGADSAAARG
jgi:ketosteroid isomerase-like protein